MTVFHKHSGTNHMKKKKKCAVFLPPSPHSPHTQLNASLLSNKPTFCCWWPLWTLSHPTILGLIMLVSAYQYFLTWRSGLVIVSLEVRQGKWYFSALENCQLITYPHSNVAWIDCSILKTELFCFPSFFFSAVYFHLQLPALWCNILGYFKHDLLLFFSQRYSLKVKCYRFCCFSFL